MAHGSCESKTSRKLIFFSTPSTEGVLHRALVSRDSRRIEHRNVIFALNGQLLTSQRHFNRENRRPSHFEFISTNQAGYFFSYFSSFSSFSASCFAALVLLRFLLFSSSSSSSSPSSSSSSASSFFLSFFLLPFFHVLEDVAAGVRTHRRTHSRRACKHASDVHADTRISIVLLGCR